MKKILAIFTFIILILTSIMPTQVLALSSNVFLSGTSGNNSNDGSSPTNAVATFAKAKELLNPGGTVWICGEVPIGVSETWELSGYGIGETGNGTIKRWDGSSVSGFTGTDANQYTGKLISVPNGISLTLKNLIMDGNKQKVTATDSMITNAGTLTIDNGIIQNNKGTIDGVAIKMMSTNGADNTSKIILNNGTTIQGHESTLSGNVETGAIRLDRGELTMNPGSKVSDNTSWRTWNWNRCNRRNINH